MDALYALISTNYYNENCICRKPTLLLRNAIMGNRILIFFLSCLGLLGSCKKSPAEDWIDFEDEYKEYITISKSDTLIMGDLRFQINWDQQLVPNENLGFLSGIKRMDIYNENILVNTFENIEDVSGLGEIDIRFYDFNMDGELDFSLPLDIGKNRWDKYFIYNKKTNKFQHQPSWDYLRIQKINPKKKSILSQPDGTDPGKIYFIGGDKLIN